MSEEAQLNITVLVTRGYIKNYHGGSDAKQKTVSQIFPVSENFSEVSTSLHIRPQYPIIHSPYSNQDHHLMKQLRSSHSPG